MTRPTTEPTSVPLTAETMPSGEYAIVEALGHSTMVGRATEVERFGAKMMQLEPLYRGFLLGPVLVGGQSLYRVTPCTPQVALDRQAEHEWDLPPSVRATIPDYAKQSALWPPAFLTDRTGEELGDARRAEL